MSGIQFIRKLRNIEKECDLLGFNIVSPKYINTNVEDRVALIPKDNDSLPVYSRGTEIFVGTIEELEVWLFGLKWARDYDKLLFGKNHEKNRLRKEQNVRNENLMRILQS